MSSCYRYTTLPHLRGGSQSTTTEENSDGVPAHHRQPGSWGAAGPHLRAPQPAQRRRGHDGRSRERRRRSRRRRVSVSRLHGMVPDRPNAAASGHAEGGRPHRGSQGLSRPPRRAAMRLCGVLGPLLSGYEETQTESSRPPLSCARRNTCGTTRQRASHSCPDWAMGSRKRCSPKSESS